MELEIIKVPNKLLLEKSKKSTLSPKLKELIANMLETVRKATNPPAAGLSAVQVGELERVFIARNFVYGQDGEEVLHIEDVVFINPKIISLSKEKELDWEGCLSIPEVYGKVIRSKKVKLKFTDLEGTEQRLTASGFFARVIQHEMDHLEGILFTTKVTGKLERDNA